VDGRQLAISSRYGHGLRGEGVDHDPYLMEVGWGGEGGDPHVRTVGAGQTKRRGDAHQAVSVRIPAENEANAAASKIAPAFVVVEELMEDLFCTGACDPLVDVSPAGSAAAG
jgi:hypothetical protein